MSTGTVAAGGAVRVEVDVEDGLLCTGSLVGTQITVDCTPGACHVELVRTGGGTRDAGPGTDAGGPRDSGGGGGHTPGSSCACDSDCVGTPTNPAVCVAGVCMTRASGMCPELGSPVGCPTGSRCWPNMAGDQLCWPDCATFSCVGMCDADGSCAATSSTNATCNPECASLCSTT